MLIHVPPYTGSVTRLPDARVGPECVFRSGESTGIMRARMCGRGEPMRSLRYVHVVGPASRSAWRPDAERMRCAVALGGNAKCHACRPRQPDAASEDDPRGIGRLLRITSAARTDPERTPNLRILRRRPVERDPSASIIGNFDEHLALGAHNEPELRERQAFEVSTLGASSYSRIDCVRGKRHGVENSCLEPFGNLVEGVDDRRTVRHGRRSGCRIRRVAGGAPHDSQRTRRRDDQSSASAPSSRRIAATAGRDETGPKLELHRTDPSDLVRHASTLPRPHPGCKAALRASAKCGATVGPNSSGSPMPDVGLWRPVYVRLAGDRGVTLLVGVGPTASDGTSGK